MNMQSSFTYDKWCHSIYLNDRHFVAYKLFSFVFPLDKLEYGWYITCGVYVKNKVGRTFTPGKPAKRE